jgi:hypothetical protein
MLFRWLDDCVRACASPPLSYLHYLLLPPPPSLFPVPHHRWARCACPTLACLVARSARQVSDARAARNPSPFPSSFLPLLTLLYFSLFRDACCMLRNACWARRAALNLKPLFVKSNSKTSKPSVHESRTRISALSSLKNPLSAWLRHETSINGERNTKQQKW